MQQITPPTLVRFSNQETICHTLVDVSQAFVYIDDAYLGLVNQLFLDDCRHLVYRLRDG